MVRVAFRGMHYIFNLVHKFGCDERGMSPNEVIDVAFHHVFPVRIALPADAVYFIADSIDGFIVVISFFQIARDVVPRGVGENDVVPLMCNVLVGLHVVNHAADVGIELFLDGPNDLVGEVQPFTRTDLVHELNDVLNRQLVKTEAHEFGLQRFVNAADVIAYQAKPHVVLRVIVAIQ